LIHHEISLSDLEYLLISMFGGFVLGSHWIQPVTKYDSIHQDKKIVYRGICDFMDQNIAKNNYLVLAFLSFCFTPKLS